MQRAPEELTARTLAHVTRTFRKLRAALGARYLDAERRINRSAGVLVFSTVETESLARNSAGENPSRVSIVRSAEAKQPPQTRCASGH